MFSPTKAKDIIELEPDWQELICTVAGFQYHDGEKVKSALRRGLVLTLKRDIQNEKSKTAVKILLNDSFLGFIPSEISSIISQNLDSNDDLFAFVISFDDNETPYYKLKIKILRSRPAQ